MKGKNKLVPRLLGITKESVMRVDEKTKDVVQEWPLTTVKRWAASPKSFTLVLCDSMHLFHSIIDSHMLYTPNPLHIFSCSVQLCITYSIFSPPCFHFHKQHPKKIIEISGSQY